MAGNISSVVPVGNQSSVTRLDRKNQSSSTSALVKYQWDIEYSRFFSFPSNLSSISPNLKPLPKTRTRFKGTWMSSSSISSLNLIYDSSNPETILIVFLGENIVEEHFACNLHFSWPQVSCDTQCAPRGSRAVFASYRDCAGQIQKFALRFATSSDAEAFMDVMRVQPSPLGMIQQDGVTDRVENGFSKTDLRPEVSSQSEFVSSNESCYRAEENLSIVNPDTTYSPPMLPALNYNCEQIKCSQEPLLGHDFDGFSGILPPSFTALLTNCSASAEQGQAMETEEIDLKSQIMKYMSDSSFHGQAMETEEIDFKSQITKYMSDSSFHEMLIKVEEVINEIGGDMTL